MEFKSGTVRVNKETAISLMFHPHSSEYEINMAFLKSFPNIPYKSITHKIKYVGGILFEMNKNGIKISKQ